jgi:hypothetical protein
VQRVTEGEAGGPGSKQVGWFFLPVCVLTKPFFYPFNSLIPPPPRARALRAPHHQGRSNKGVVGGKLPEKRNRNISQSTYTKYKKFSHFLIQKCLKVVVPGRGTINEPKIYLNERTIVDFEYFLYFNKS